MESGTLEIVVYANNVLFSSNVNSGNDGKSAKGWIIKIVFAILLQP